MLFDFRNTTGSVGFVGRAQALSRPEHWCHCIGGSRHHPSDNGDAVGLRRQRHLPSRHRRGARLASEILQVNSVRTVRLPRTARIDPLRTYARFRSQAICLSARTGR